LFLQTETFLLTPLQKPFNLVIKKIYTDKGAYETFCNQPETKFMAVAFPANMAMAVAPVIKDALDSVTYRGNSFYLNSWLLRAQG